MGHQVVYLDVIQAGSSQDLQTLPGWCSTTDFS